MEKVGFIGLGRMGRPMASNLCRKGFRLTVNDINQDAVRELELLQAASAPTVAEVTRASDIIVTMLPNSAVVADVIDRADGVIANAKPGSLILDMSTIDPETTDRLARPRSPRGCVLSMRPSAASPAMRIAAKSLFMVGGSVADFERVKPLLEAMGNTIYHCGEVGNGTRTKLVNNFLAVSSCQMNAEALALSQRFGLNLERTLDVLYGTTAVNGQLKIAWPSKVLADDIEPGFTIDLAHKRPDADHRFGERRQGADADGRGRPRGLQRGASPRLRRPRIFPRWSTYCVTWRGSRSRGCRRSRNDRARSLCSEVRSNALRDSLPVMPGRRPGIHDLTASPQERRGCPYQVRA